MLFRKLDETNGEDVLAIAQPSHAWLSGQILRAWGNQAFAAPTPREEVCLGAEQHDIGWLSWEAELTLNPATGRPHEFREVSATVHTALWSQGVRLALGFGLYPALLVSLHAKTIYDRYFDWANVAPEEAAAAHRFLAGQAVFQQDAAGALVADLHYGEDASPAALDRNRRLVAAADWLSLTICWGVRGGADAAVAVPDVPTMGTAATELRLWAPDGDPARLVVAPWPFAVERVALICEGRRLQGRFSDEAAMRAALDGAGRVTVRTDLRPGT